MKQKWKLTICSLAMISALLISKAYAQETAQQKAAQSAKSWLALVDAGKYGQSWNGVSQYLKQKITKQQWVAELTQVRSPLGAVKSRTFARVQLRNDLRGLPAGQYAAVQFTTTFDKAPPTPEVVAMMLENGRWRVVAYFPQAHVNGQSK
jgi:hypothetical protein